MEPDFRTYKLLKPISRIWAAVSSVRNRLFDKGILRSETFRLPVISVGNITVGGTGKSPHTAYIASLLARSGRTAILSRGYGRQTKGFRMVSPSDTYRSVGDEPLMLSILLPDVCVAVDEDRAHGIRTIINKVNPRVIVLDDAFQHRKVTPSLNILLINYNRNILLDCPMPAGRLRESASNRDRADIMVVTKCPQGIGLSEMKSISAELVTARQQRVWFSTMEYGPLYRLSDHTVYSPDISTPILAVTGIASPDAMVAHLKDTFREVTLISYPDHHRFTSRNLLKISRTLDSIGSGAIIVTTEKDASRFLSADMPPGLIGRIFVLPIAVRFLKDGDLFDSLITEHVESFENNNSHDNT